MYNIYAYITTATGYIILYCRTVHAIYKQKEELEQQGSSPEPDHSNSLVG